LTIADVDEAAQLPMKVKANEVVLIKNTSGRWETLKIFEFSR
jgi:hypothetical protein